MVEDSAAAFAAGSAKRHLSATLRFRQWLQGHSLLHWAAILLASLCSSNTQAVAQLLGKPRHGVGACVRAHAIATWQSSYLLFPALALATGKATARRSRGIAFHYCETVRMACLMRKRQATSRQRLTLVIRTVRQQVGNLLGGGMSGNREQALVNQRRLQIGW